jgi:hypothetical protein
MGSHWQRLRGSFDKCNYKINQLKLQLVEQAHVTKDTFFNVRKLP